MMQIRNIDILNTGCKKDIYQRCEQDIFDEYSDRPIPTNEAINWYEYYTFDELLSWFLGVCKVVRIEIYPKSKNSNDDRFFKIILNKYDEHLVPFLLPFGLKQEGAGGALRLYCSVKRLIDDMHIHKFLSQVGHPDNLQFTGLLKDIKKDDINYDKHILTELCSQKRVFNKNLYERGEKRLPPDFTVLKLKQNDLFSDELLLNIFKKNGELLANKYFVKIISNKLLTDIDKDFYQNRNHPMFSMPIIPRGFCNGVFPLRNILFDIPSITKIELDTKGRIQPSSLTRFKVAQMQDFVPFFSSNDHALFACQPVMLGVLLDSNVQVREIASDRMGFEWVERQLSKSNRLKNELPAEFCKIYQDKYLNLKSEIEHLFNDALLRRYGFNSNILPNMYFILSYYIKDINSFGEDYVAKIKYLTNNNIIAKEQMKIILHKIVNELEEFADTYSKIEFINSIKLNCKDFLEYYA